ncbi:MAG: ABC transporter permease [Ancrocorticia sp.]
MRISDLLADTATELQTRMSRTVLMIAAVALSTGALLASVGISQNAARQIDTDLAAATVDLVMVGASAGAKDESNSVFPEDTVERIERLETVAVAGMILPVSGGNAGTEVSRDVAGVGDATLTVHGITAGYLAAARIESTGELQWMLDGTHNVAFLGEAAAADLGIPVTGSLDGISLTINSVNYSVVGFLPGEHTLSRSVAIPYANGLHITGDDGETQVLIRTEPGAGSQISKVARQQILPQAPEKLLASQVVSADRARGSVAGQMARQVMWIGAFLIVLTVLLIANSMIVSVTARTTEIGVRRALGSSRSSVAAAFWCEGALTGALGGLAGSAVAAIVMVGVAWLSGWTAHLGPFWIGLGPLLGLAVGLVASAYPAFRASGIHPAIAVRAD